MSADGGLVLGPGDGPHLGPNGEDTLRARLSKGEYVISAATLAAADRYQLILDGLNRIQKISDELDGLGQQQPPT